MIETIMILIKVYLVCAIVNTVTGLLRFVTQDAMGENYWYAPKWNFFPLAFICPPVIYWFFMRKTHWYSGKYEPKD